MNAKPMERLMALARKGDLIRPRELEAHGIARTYLQLAVRRGMLKRIRRGLYMEPKVDITEHFTLSTVAKHAPKAVFCLLTALRFHNIGTQNPPEVWLAIDGKAHKPVLDYPRIRVVRFSGRAMTEGVEDHKVGNTVIRVTNPAKTVADCFKYRNKVGLDVALEASRECRRERKCSADTLWKYAKICRVANVMRPYLEAMS